MAVRRTVPRAGSGLARAPRGSVRSRRRQRDSRRQATAKLGASATASALYINSELKALATVDNAFAQRPLLSRALRDGRLSPADRGTIQETLRQLAAIEGVGTSFLAWPDGRLIDIVPATPSIIGKDFSFRDWYRGVTASGRPYVSRAYRSQATGRPLVVAAAAPVYAAGSHRRVAILVAAYELDALQRFATSFAREEGISLSMTDQNGVAVAPAGARTTGLVSERRDPGVAAALSGSQASRADDRRNQDADRIRAGLATRLDAQGGTALEQSLLVGRPPPHARVVDLGASRRRTLRGCLALPAASASARSRSGGNRRSSRSSATHRRHQSWMLDATAEAILLVDSTGRPIRQRSHAANGARVVRKRRRDDRRPTRPADCRADDRPGWVPCPARGADGGSGTASAGRVRARLRRDARTLQRRCARLRRAHDRPHLRLSRHHQEARGGAPEVGSARDGVA